MLLKAFPVRRILPLAAVLVAAGFLAGCSRAAPADDPSMRPLSEMSAEVQRAPVVVQQAYRYAAGNSDLMRQIPCYCGCGAVGHKSNYDCYFFGTDAGGKPAFDSHALGCTLCVDITLDALRLKNGGKTVAEIRSYVDSTYSKYGTSNMPPAETP